MFAHYSGLPRHTQGRQNSMLVFPSRQSHSPRETQTETGNATPFAYSRYRKSSFTRAFITSDQRHPRQYHNSQNDDLDTNLNHAAILLNLASRYHRDSMEPIFCMRLSNASTRNAKLGHVITISVLPISHLSALMPY